jgi:outer membrane protein assembly factor BamB
MTIDWPARTRYIPTYAASLVFELSLKNAPAIRYTLVVDRPDDRPSTQSVAFRELLTPGAYVLAGVARRDAAGQGASVASAVTTVTVVANQTFTAELTLVSTIASLGILGQPLSVPIGTQLLLAGQARDPDGKLVVLPASALTWSQVSGEAVGTIRADGLFQAKTIGTARVRLSEPNIPLSVESDITVTTGNGGGIGLAASGWPKGRGDLANTGRGAGRGAAGRIVWESPPIDAPIVLLGTPIVGLAGLIAVCGFEAQRTGGSVGHLVGLDGATGALRWRHRFARGTACTPAIGADGVVYAGAEDGVFCAFDGTDGTIRWQKTFPGNNDDFEVTLTPDGRLYLATPSAQLLALSSTDGTALWPPSVQLGAASTPAIGAAGVLIATPGAVQGIDPSTGAVRWTFQPEGQGIFLKACAAVGGDGTVYFGTSNGDFYALDGGTGTKRWKVHTGASFQSSPAIGADGTVYFASNDGDCYAVDGGDGSVRWKTGGHGPARRDLALTGNQLLLPRQSDLVALSVTDGSLLWSLPIGTSFVGSPTVDTNGRIYYAGVKSGESIPAVFAID